MKNLEIDVDFQSIYQIHTGTFRLIESRTSNHFEGPFISNAKNQLTATIVCQGAAAFDCYFIIKTVFGFLELDIFPLFCFQQFRNTIQKYHYSLLYTRYSLFVVSERKI